MKFILSNGVLTQTIGDKVMDKVNGISEKIVNGEMELIIKPFLALCKELIVTIFSALTHIMPELTVFICLLLVTIGMFNGFVRWGLKAGLVYVGGVVWLSLAHFV